MGAFANLIVRIAADVQDFDRNTQRAANRIKAFGREMSDAGRALSASISLPLIGVGAIALKTAADFDSLKRGLTAVSGSSAEAERQFGRLKEVAKLPGLSFQEAIRGATNLQAAGLSANLAERSLKAFGNALATVGRGSADLAGVNLALGQIASKGKITAQEINQLAERVPQIRRTMLEAFGTADTEVLQKMGVSADVFIEKVVGSLEKLPPVTGGIQNSFENVRDSMQQLLAEVGKSIIPFAEAFINQFAEPAIGSLKELAGEFDALGPSIKGAVVGMTALTAITPLLIVALGSTITNAVIVSGALTKASLALYSTSTAATALRGALVLAAGAFLGWELGRWLREVTGFGEQIDKLANRLGFVTEKIKEQTRAETDQEFANRKLEEAKERLRLRQEAKNREDEKAKEITRKLTLQELLRKEVVDRGNSAIQKSVDIIREWLDASKPYGTQLEMHRAEIDNTVLSMRLLNAELERKGMIEAKIAEIDQSKARTGPLALEDIFGSVGLKTQVELRREADRLGTVYERTIELQRKGQATTRDVQRAYEAWVEAEKAAVSGLKTHADQSSRSMAVIQRQISTVFTDLSRGLADAIVPGEKLHSVFQKIIHAITRMGIEAVLQSKVVQNAINAALNSISGLLSKIPVIGGVFGGAASSAAGSAGQAAGGIARVAGGGAANVAAGAISAGLSSTLGAVFGGVSAVSGVVGNFQMAGMNKSLDLIVKHTLQTANQLIYGLQPQINQYLPWLESIHQRLREQGGGGAPVTININGSGDPRAVAQAVVRELKLSGALA